MKKILAILLALVATTSLWAYDFKQYGIYYNFLDDKHVEVTVDGILICPEYSLYPLVTSTCLSSRKL